MLVFKCYLTASTQSLSSLGEITNMSETLPISGEEQHGREQTPPVLWSTALSLGAVSGDSKLPIFAFGDIWCFYLAKRIKILMMLFSCLGSVDGRSNNVIFTILQINVHADDADGGYVIHRMLLPTSVLPLSSAVGQKLRPWLMWPLPASPL